MRTTSRTLRARHRWMQRASIALAASAVCQVGIVLTPRSWRDLFVGRPSAPWNSQHVITDGGRLWLTDRFDYGFFGELYYAQTGFGDDAVVKDSPHHGTAVSFTDSIVVRWDMFSRVYASQQLPKEPPWEYMVVQERAEGWPWRCVRGEKHRIAVAVATKQGRLLQVSRSVGYINLPYNIEVPWLPIWSGLLLDLSVLALPWYLLMGAGAAARRRRRRHGHCEECNYDLTGLEGLCPECGMAR